MNCLVLIISFVSLCVSCWNLYFLYKLKNIEATLNTRKERLEVLNKFQDFYEKLINETYQIETTWTILRNPQNNDEIDNQSKRLLKNIENLRPEISKIYTEVEGLFNEDEEEIIKKILLLVITIRSIITNAKYHFGKKYFYLNIQQNIKFYKNNVESDEIKISENEYTKSINEIDELLKKIKEIIQDYDRQKKYISELKNKYCRINNILKKGL